MSESLTSIQLDTLALLSAGSTVRAAADAIGISRNTIYAWFNRPAFHQACALAEHQRAESSRDRAQALVDNAFNTIAELLANPHAPAAVRLKAALAVTDRAHDPLPDLPADIDDQVARLNSNVIDFPLRPDSEKLHKVHNFPQTADEIVDLPEDLAARETENEAPPRPQPAVSNKIGRNELCPCGSGIKYKRCCLGKPGPTPSPPGPSEPAA